MVSLLSEGELYDANRLQQIELAHTGKYAPHHGFVRPPFYAAIFWILSQLDYSWAFYVWNVLLAGALVGFVLLWRPPRWEITLLFTCISVPAFAGFINGQDAAFFRFCLAFCSLLAPLRQSVLGRNGVEPLRREVFISSCPSHFGLWGQRAWRLGGGLVAGGCGLLLLSFLVAGWSWPLQFYESATRATFSPYPGLMPNLHGLLAAGSYGLWLEVLIGAGFGGGHLDGCS